MIYCVLHKNVEVGHHVKKIWSIESKKCGLSTILVKTFVFFCEYFSILFVSYFCSDL